MIKKFAAIDVETANQYQSSICSIGVVIVENGVVVDKIYSLVRPRPHFYKFWNTKIHGLTIEDTKHAGEFPEIWFDIAPLIKDLPLVAHNSRFDEGCLRAVHAAYKIPYPNYPFFCTYRASVKVFGKDLSKHNLLVVATHCGFELKNHHHALSDAEACAWIATKIL